MATYKQVDFVTESKQRGGKRDNAGAKLKHGEKTAVIRLPVSLVEKIKQGSFENVTESNNDLAAKLQNEIVTNSKLQHEIIELKAELAKAEENYNSSVIARCELAKENKELKATIADLEATEREYIRSMKQKLLKLSPTELALFYDKLKDVLM